MENKKIFIIVPILWFVSAGVWFVTFCMDLYKGTTPTGLVLMHVLCVAASLAAAIVNLIRYKKMKKEES